MTSERTHLQPSPLRVTSAVSTRLTVVAACLVAVVMAIAATSPGATVAADTTTVVPVRVLDTRDGTGTLAGRLLPDRVLELSITAADGADAVILNLTATDATAPGYATAWPCDEPRPTTSVLNFEPGRSIPNAIVVSVPSGRICLAVSAPVHLVGDLMATFNGTSSLNGTAPRRVVDTRVASTPFRPGEVRPVAVVASSDVPPSAATVALNVTVVESQADGFVTVAPCAQLRGSAAPATSTVNFRAGETVAALTIAGLDAGEVCISSSVAAHLLVDVFGWAPANEIRSTPPVRLLDTRATGSAPSGEQVAMRIAGRGGVPNNAQSALLTVTAIGDDFGHVTAWPCDQPKPPTSVLNMWPGAVRSNLMFIGLSESDGELCFEAWTVGGSAVDIIADVTAWIDGDAEREAPTPPAMDPPATAPSGPTGPGTLPPGSALPSGAECAGRVTSSPEIRPGNAAANSTVGTRANGRYPRVDGNFIGTTDEIIQWAACKWGIDADIVRAQLVKESWWHMWAVGDNGESYGVGQVRMGYHDEAFADDNAIRSTAYNVDYTYAVWRDCYEGNMTWLNQVERGATYGSGDVWGCLGVWFSGRWYVPSVSVYLDGGPTNGYGDLGVRQHLATRTWEHPAFLSG